MPILDVEIVSDAEHTHRPALAQRIADGVAEVLNSPPQGTWVRLKVLRPDDYAENGGSATEVRPVFVSVLKQTNPVGKSLAEEVRVVTMAVAQACGRPSDSVHVRYEVPGAGRQAFGGTLI